MGVTEQLNIESKSAGAADPFRAVAPLDSNRNPFASGAPGSRLGRPAQTAFGELVRLIGLRTRVVVVLGKPGTGKTVLVSMVARACADMGLSVRRIERGDLLTEAAADRSDVLLVDEADSMSNAVLQSFLSASDRQPDRTMVFMCLPSCISRFSFSGTEAAVLELSPLSLLDARLYLTERGNSIGRPNLFTPQALDLVIDASRGVPRLLRSIAGIAYFNAASGDASQIDATHAEAAASMRNELRTAPSGAPHELSPCSEPEFHAADPDESVVATSAETADWAAESELGAPLDIEVFARTEAARDMWSSRSNKALLALAIVLLIASAGNFALMSGRAPRSSEPQQAQRSPAIAVARPAEAAAPQSSSEGASPSIAAPVQSASAAGSALTQSTQAPIQSAPAAETAPTRSTPAAASAPTRNASRAPATNTEGDDPVICAYAQMSRDPRALPIAGRCPGVPRTLRGNAAPSSAAPAMPRAAEVDRLTSPKPAIPATDATAFAQSTPAEPVRTIESTPPQAQSSSEAPAPPAAQRSDSPAVAADKVQTQDRGQAVPAQDATEQNATLPRESGGIPIIIFGYRLW